MDSRKIDECVNPPVNDNQIIRVYNQFPRRYQYVVSSSAPSVSTEDTQSVIERMTADLDRIATLGFNVVWVNPLQKTGKYPKEESKGRVVTGSLYAMLDDRELNPDFFPPQLQNDAREQLLINYTRTAKRLGLRPIFDLVLRHVNRELLDPQGHTPIDSAFQELCQGRLDRPKDTDGWKDAAAFRVQTDADVSYWIDRVFEPLIQRYVERYGFEGVRVDAVSSASAHLQQRALEIVRSYTRKYHNRDPILLGEMMSKNPKPLIPQYQPVGFTHVLQCSIFYHNFDQDPRPGWVQKNQECLQELTQQRGGVVGFTGNHDTGTLKGVCLYDRGLLGAAPKEGHRILKKDWIKPRLTEMSERKDHRERTTNVMVDRLFCAALLPNAGYYLLAGDEYGALFRPSVFDHHREERSVRDHWGGKEDLSSCIRNINRVLEQLPVSAVNYTVETDVIALHKHKIRYVLRQSGVNKEHSCLVALTSATLAACSQEQILKTLRTRRKRGPVTQVFVLTSNGEELTDCSSLF